MTFTIVSFESRRAQEMARLIERHGAAALMAPSMVEVSVNDASLDRFASSLDRGEVDALLLLTGVGARRLVQALAERDGVAAEVIVERLSRVRIGARGPKVFAALKELQLRDYVAATEPFQWSDLARALELRWSLAGMRIWIQEYGTPHPELVAWLGERGALVDSVRVYEWQRPADLAPMHAALDAILDRRADALLFTSAPQVDAVLELARERGVESDVRRGLGDAFVGSIGPACSERLRSRGLRIDVEPEHSHMGHLVKAVVERLKGSSP